MDTLFGGIYSYQVCLCSVALEVLVDALLCYIRRLREKE